MREGSTHVSVYSEALLAYLYDPAFEDEITRFEAEHGLLADSDGQKLPPARDLAERGVVCVIEQYSDDPLTIEILVGDPLTPKEARTIPLWKPVRGNLTIVSGMLAIHSPATAPFADPIAGETPTILDVEPGRYVVSVYHVDFDEFRRRHGEDVEWDGSVQVAVLTPADQAKPIKKPKLLLEYPNATHRGLRRWSLRDGKVTGEVVRSSLFGISSLVTSAPEPAVRDLGGEFGDVLGMELRGEPCSLVISETIVDELQAEAVFGTALVDRSGFTFGGYFGPVRGVKEPRLFICTVVANTRASVASENDRFSLWSTGENVAPVPIPRGEGRILAAGPKRLFLDRRIDELGEASQDVQFEFGGVPRRVRIAPTYTAALDEMMRFALQPATLYAKERVELIEERWQLICRSTPEAPPAEKAELEAEIQRLESRISEYRIPDEARSGMPLIAEPFRDWLDPTREITMLRALHYDHPLGLPPL